MILKKLFGKKVKQLRENKGLTQQELAEMCDLRPNSIAVIEVGKRGVTFSTIEVLAEKLEVEVWELFDFSFDTTEKKEKLVNDLNKIINSFNVVLLEHMISYAKSIKKLLNNK